MPPQKKQTLKRKHIYAYIYNDIRRRSWVLFSGRGRGGAIPPQIMKLNFMFFEVRRCFPRPTNEMWISWFPGAGGCHVPPSKEWKSNSIVLEGGRRPHPSPRLLASGLLVVLAGGRPPSYTLHVATLQALASASKTPLDIIFTLPFYRSLSEDRWISSYLRIPWRREGW